MSRQEAILSTANPSNNFPAFERFNKHIEDLKNLQTSSNTQVRITAHDSGNRSWVSQNCYKPLQTFDSSHHPSDPYCSRTRHRQLQFIVLPFRVPCLIGGQKHVMAWCISNEWLTDDQPNFWGFLRYLHPSFWGKARIIRITGLGQNEFGKLSAKLGCRPYLSRPVQLRRIYNPCACVGQTMSIDLLLQTKSI